jgi:hypothetical protein
MNFKASISTRAVRNALPPLLMLFLSMNFLWTIAHASDCEVDMACWKCSSESQWHFAAEKPYTGCASQPQSIPCALEETEARDHIQLILPNGRLVASSFLGLTPALPAQVVPEYLSWRYKSSRQSELTNLHTPIYLQNLSLRC